MEGRDALWAHPDLLPSAEDLDDPAGFVERTGAGGSGGEQDSGTDWDAALREINEGEIDEGEINDDGTEPTA